MKKAMEKAESPRDRFSRLLPEALVLAAALIIRAAYFASWRHHPLFEPLLPGYDMTRFHQWAQEIAAGRLSPPGTFYQGPLYPYLLGALYALPGPDVITAVLFQHLLGAGSVALCYLLARKLFGRGPALLAAAMMALTPIFFCYEGLLKADTLVTFLDLGFLLALVSFRPGQPWRGALTAGLLLGLSSLARANALVLLPLGMYWLSRQSRREGLARGRALLPALLLAGTTFLVIGPATVHNLVRGNKFVLVSDNFSENWRIGNSAGSTGGFCYPEGRLLPVGSGDFWRLQLKKTGLLLGHREQPNNVDFLQLREELPLLRVPLLSWGFFLAFGLAGALLYRDRWRKLLPLYAYLLLLSAGIVAFFVTSRFRLPLWPPLVILSGAALYRVFSAAIARRYAQALAVALPAGALAATLILTAPRTIEGRYFDNMLLIHERRSDREGAIHQLRAKLAHYPDDGTALWRLAYYLHLKGERQEPLLLLERLLALHPDHPQLLREGGLLYLRLGERSRGQALLERYLELSPADPDSLRLRGLITAGRP